MLQRVEKSAPQAEELEAIRKTKDKAKLYRNRYRDEEDIVEPSTQDASTSENGPPGQGTTPDDPNRAVEEQNLSPEEVTYKKRYGDLRRMQQKEKEEADKRIAELSSRIEQLEKSDGVMPQTEEQVQEWMSQYPDLAATIMFLADKQAKTRVETLQKRVQDVESRSLEVEREKAYLKLSKIHPDVDDIRASDKFHTWVGDQPESIQSWFYDNDTDYLLTAKGLDLFKAETGWGNKSKGKRKDNSKDMSRGIPEASGGGGGREPAVMEGKRIWKTSEIQRLKAHEYAEVEAELDAAAMEGRIEDDLKSLRL